MHTFDNGVDSRLVLQMLGAGPCCVQRTLLNLMCTSVLANKADVGTMLNLLQFL